MCVVVRAVYTTYNCLVKEFLFPPKNIFSRDADEMENWIAEKLQLATEESYKDPANIQSKHQKHQAFEAELAANADRIQSVLAMGQNLIDKHQCAGSEEAVQVSLQCINIFLYVVMSLCSYLHWCEITYIGNSFFFFPLFLLLCTMYLSLLNEISPIPNSFCYLRCGISEVTVDWIVGVYSL